MKVLSIKEPYASLIKDGIKKIETRSWKTKYRGKIYIHASIAKLSKEVKENEELMNLININNLSYGHIICSANLIDCVEMTEEFINEVKKNNNEYITGLYKVGRYGWILDDIKILKEKIPAKGKLGIWNYESEDL